jgi:hypothetical protein
MLISTLLLIPWIIFGFKHQDNRFIGLTQPRKSILILFVIEITFWLVLMLLLGKPNPDIAGQGSFAWTYQFIYEKGIFPTWLISENISSSLGDRIDKNYQLVYLMTALIMDYIVLFLVSPRVTGIFKQKRGSV